MDFIFVDLLNPAPDFKQKLKNFDFVINCVGQVTNPINVCYELNTKGISNLINGIKNTAVKLIHISTVAVYGSTNFADEANAINPETPYATCKAFAEHLISSSLEESQYCIFRLSNLYGENKIKEYSITFWRNQFPLDRKLFFNNNGNLVRYFLHVEDCASILVDTIDKQLNGIYNLIGNEKYTIKELISLVESIAGIIYMVKFTSSNPYDNIIEISDKKIESVIFINYKNNIRDYFKKNFVNPN